MSPTPRRRPLGRSDAPRMSVERAVRDAETAENRAVRALDQAQRPLGHGEDTQDHLVQATIAVAEAQLAVVAETRALRLVLTEALAPTVITAEAVKLP